MIICIAGKNDIAVEILKYLLSESVSKNEIIVISNKTDNESDNWQRSLLKLAKEEKIKIVKLEEAYNIENLLFLSLEFDKIIKPLKFNTKKLFNIHFSLLPKYKGMYTSIMPILNNETYSGVTFHNIDKGIDTGEIVVQSIFKIDIMDNARSLYHKYIKEGIILVKQCVDKICEKKYLECIVQDYTLSTYYSKSAINFDNIYIDLCQTSISIHNQIRAYNFREYQIPKIFNHQIISSKILNSSSSDKVGKILYENDISFVISTIDKNLVLYKDKVKDMFLACENNSIELVNRLIQIPNIIDVQNQEGWSALIIAIYNNNKEIVKNLIINGTNLSITNFKGTTPLMYAKSAYIKHGDDNIIKLLISLGANVYEEDYKNKNVLDYCIENNELNALKVIEENIK